MLQNAREPLGGRHEVRDANLRLFDAPREQLWLALSTPTTLTPTPTPTPAPPPTPTTAATPTTSTVPPALSSITPATAATAASPPAATAPATAAASPAHYCARHKRLDARARQGGVGLESAQAHRTVRHVSGKQAAEVSAQECVHVLLTAGNWWCCD